MSNDDGAPSPFAGDRAPLPARVDLYTGAVLFALALGVIAVAWNMPTFIEQSRTGLTAPGIVPGFHASVVAILAVLLGVRAIRRGGLRGGAQGRALEPGDARSLGTATLLGVLYAGAMVGRLPFWLASALFVFAFCATFEWRNGSAGRVRRLIEAAALGIATGIVVTLVFERIFLVRLP